jgi:hypothetical protein
VSGQLHAPAALPPGKISRFPLYRRLGGPQSRSGEAPKRTTGGKISICCLFLAGCFLGLLFDSEDGGSTLLRNVSESLPGCKVSHSRRQYRLARQLSTSFGPDVPPAAWLYQDQVCAVHGTVPVARVRQQVQAGPRLVDERAVPLQMHTVAQRHSVPA